MLQWMAHVQSHAYGLQCPFSHGTLSEMLADGLCSKHLCHTDAFIKEKKFLKSDSSESRLGLLGLAMLRCVMVCCALAKDENQAGGLLQEANITYRTNHNV